MEIIMVLSQINHDLLPDSRRYVSCLRRTGRSEIIKGNACIDDTECRHDGNIPSGRVHNAVSILKKLPPQPCRIICHRGLCFLLCADAGHSDRGFSAKELHGGDQKQDHGRDLQDAQHISKPEIGGDQVIKGQYRSDIDGRCSA